MSGFCDMRFRRHGMHNRGRDHRVHGGRALNDSRVWVDCAARIAGKMSEKGVTSARISVETGIPANQIDSWLECNSVPEADQIPAICTAVGITPNQVYGY